MQKITIYDTTLRDGNQAEDVNLSLEDKLKIALKLDEFGVDYIEGGWPGASPVDTAFFEEIARYDLKHAKIAAFGSTHHMSNTPENDANLAHILAAKPHVGAIVGKCCEHHVQMALRADPKKYLNVITGSLAFLKKSLTEVFFDAEHFFDGFYRNADYALAVLEAAVTGGAQSLVLCDTNGGMLPHQIREAVLRVKESFPKIMIGIHAHNDCELAIANSLSAVESGATVVQGTINGIGERCGNANLCSIIPNLELKSDNAYSCVPSGNLEMLRELSLYVAEVANMTPFDRQPFVGRSAFAHKGGIHVSAVNRDSTLYEHIAPDMVGNEQRILLTEMAGRSNIVSLAKRFGFQLDKDSPVVKGLLSDLKERSTQGYDYAAAEASMELLLMRKLGRRGVRDFFTLRQLRVIEHKVSGEEAPTSEASIIINVEGVEEHTASLGHGPVNALDTALRKALSTFYPRLKEMRLVDFKVRVLSAQENSSGTASLVRVLIESADTTSNWVTVGVSYNIIEASWQALAESVNYKLYKDENATNKKH